ncbi:MAG: hypothetical protein HYU43_03265, partial [Armatimonadetes bacterium]|nr:hypothetical protein [Armatimonadota bacterium]
LGEKFEGELALEMRWELVDRRGLAQQPISIEAGATARIKLPFNVGKEEFGRELRATLLRGGKPVHSASETFGVSENIWKVGISGAGWSAGGSFGWSKRIDDLVRVNRANYGNFYEEFAWAPSDYDDMTPDTEEFWSGQTQYHGTVSDCKAVIDGLHQHGIKAVTYGKSCGGGLPGFETMRKHPDWFIRYDVGMLIEGGPEVDFLDRMRALDYSLAAKDGWQSWQGQWVDSRVEAAVRFGAEEIVRSTDLLGWDGIRWDGQFNAYGENADEISARNTRLVKEICWKKYPRFVHGYNYLLAQMSDKELKVNPYPMVPMLKDFEECCRDGGLIMNESLRDFSNRNFSHRTMWVFGECMALEGDWVSGLGGFYLAIGFDRATLLDSLYNTIFFLATGARPYGAAPGATSLGHFWQFATRYSCLVYDNTRRRLAGPDSWIRVESPWPLWWKPYTYLRSLGDHRRQILINLIGKPVEERFNELKQPPPPLQKNVKVAFRLPQGWTARQAHQVSIEIEGFQRPLELQAHGDETVLVLPECRYWSMVALDIEGGKEAGVFPLTDPVAAAREGLEQQKKAAIEAQKKAAEASGVKAPEAAQAPPAETAADRDRVAQPDFPKIEKLELKRNGERDVLLALGAYHWMYEMAEAIGWAGGASISEAKLNVKGGWFRGAESSMPDLPADFDTIRHLDALVLNNVPAVFMTLRQRYAMAKFVEAGGGLLVIGGEWSLDRGGFQNTLLGDLLPVELPAPSPAGTTLYPDGLVLQPTDDLALRDRVDWSAEPRIFCLHHVKPKPDAKILLTAGGQPLVVEGRSGKGRVIVFAGSTMGLVPPGRLAFWYW